MPKLIGKVIAVALVSAASVGAGIVVLLGQHAYNDYLNLPLGWGLIALGAIFAGYGLLIIVADLAAERGDASEKKVHLTPRAGDYTAPPAWHMGNVGRPGAPIMSLEQHENGGVKVMSVKASNLDAVIFVVVLLVWTAAALYWFAPK